VWVFWGCIFLGGCTQKNPPGFWVRTQVSEPCTQPHMWIVEQTAHLQKLDIHNNNFECQLKTYLL